MYNYKPMQVVILHDMLHFSYIIFIIIIDQQTLLQ